ncbi:MAG: hypothetical protein K5762_04485 [Bacilli bacterium]|nr:hypothetical protein [Bacilli bacterium]
MFSNPPIIFQESRPSIKYQNNTLNRDALSPFTGINAESVVFDKEGFEDHYEDEFLDGDITEEKYNDLLAESEAFSQVTETISELVQSGEGHVDQNGNFIPSNPGTTSVASEDEIAETIDETKRKAKNANMFFPEDNNLWEFARTPFVINSSYNIFTGWDVTFGPLGSVLMGILGIIVSCLNVFNKKNYAFNKHELLTAGLTNDSISHIEMYGKWIVPTPAFQQAVIEIESLFGDATILLTAFTSILFILTGVMHLMTLTGMSWIIELILLIASVYLPPLITGISMTLGGIKELDTTEAHIWYFWSDYQVIRRNLN